jgi:hypothetical protein
MGHGAIKPVWNEKQVNKYGLIREKLLSVTKSIFI